MATLPIIFERNEGQFPSHFDYGSRAQAQAVFLDSTGARIQIGTRDTAPSEIALTFIGARAEAKATEGERARTTTNYIHGSDRGKWLTNVPTYRTVQYDDVYDGIDVEYHGRNGILEYDFIVAPGADWRTIALAVDGATPVIDKTGDLVLQHGASEIRHRAPYAYQDIDGERKRVDSRYVLREGRVAFDIGAYDETRELVIDPILDFSRAVEPLLQTVVYDMRLDAEGNPVITGTIWGPASWYREGSRAGGGFDVLVTKLNSAATEVIFSTYMGGAETDWPSELAVDPSGNVYVTGITYSGNFPTSDGAYSEYARPGYATEDNQLFFFRRGYVFKVDGDTGSLVYSTYLEDPQRGRSPDTLPAAIAADALGHAIVTGTTSSEFYPTTPGAFADLENGGVFLTKLSPDGKTLVFSTGLDAGSGEAVDVDEDNFIYVAGGSSPDTTTTPGAYLTGWVAGATPSYVMKFDPDGNRVFSTLFPYGIADIELDASGDIVTTWMTLAKLNPTGTALLAATPLKARTWRVDIDLQDFVYVRGLTEDGAPIVNPIQTESESPIYLAKYDANLTQPLFASVFGPTNNSQALAVDGNGNIWFAGSGGGRATWLKGPQPPWANLEGDAFVARLNPLTFVPMAIDFVTPGAIPHNTGGEINIRGHGFMQGARLFFGSVEVPQLQVVVVEGGTRIRAPIPNHPVGRDSIRVLNPNGQQVQVPNIFEFVEDIYKPESGTPTHIPTLGTEVTLMGRDFPANPMIRIGTAGEFPFPKGDPMVPVKQGSSSTTLTFDVPPLARPGPQVFVRVLYPRGDLHGSRPLQYLITASPAPTIAQIRPTAGPTNGGTFVTITGSNFHPRTRVAFGTVYAKNMTFISPTTIMVPAPPNVAGNVMVEVINPDTQRASMVNAYSYRGLVSLSPRQGPATGGTTVTITGAGFSAGAVTVSFGGAAASNVTVVSDTQVTAVTPAHAAGVVDVRLTIGTEESKLVKAFTYLDPAPTITSVSPTSGAEAGGTLVVIRGTNFKSGATVFFGGSKAANVAFVDATQLNATTAPGVPGLVDVKVKNPDLQTATSVGAFTYRGIANISPTRGSPGTVVTINGGGFVGGATVRFGGTLATNVTVGNGGHQITATVPERAPGTVDVSVTNPDTLTFTKTGAFNVLPPPPTITNIAPASAYTGDAITITGTNYVFVTEVEFNGLAAEFTVDSATQITAFVPEGVTNGPITVTTESGTATSATNFTILFSAATITSFTPTSGTGGTIVTITGTRMGGASAVRFGGVASTNFTVDSTTQITATAPATGITGPICIDTPGPFTGCSATDFAYGPRINSFTPESGVPGDSVTITGANFTGATSVTFGGASATFTVNSASSITATVPAGAITGPIIVTTAIGSGASGSPFLTPPQITSFSPTVAARGTNVTITGLRFTGATAVAFGGVNATTFAVTNATTINATVPVGAVTGPITVTTPGGSASSATAFEVAETPIISSFSPTKGTAGTAVSLTGNFFVDVISVKFNGVPATFTVNSPTSISTVVPEGATNGFITVTSTPGSGSTTTIFSLPPVLSSFAPNAGSVGASVKLSGNNFVGTTAVSFGGTVAQFTVDSQNQITATVPVGASTGAITVTTPYGPVSSAFAFTVLGPTTPTVTATATSATSVSLSWLGNAEDTYEIRRVLKKTDNAVNFVIARVTGTSYVDNTVQAGKTYIYSIANLSNGLISNNEYATTIIFTDDPLTVGTKVKSTHLIELRNAVNAMRVAAALPTVTWTDTGAAGTPIRQVHITELRSALSAALIELSRFIEFTDPTLTAGMRIRMVHVRELREAVK